MRSLVPVTRLRHDAGVLVLPRDVYLSASMTRALEMRTHVDTLERHGLRCVSTWVVAASDDATPAGRAAAAKQDLGDLDDAGLVIAFTEPPGLFTGGRHVELGYALAQGKRLVVIGPSENVFHDHPRVDARFDTWPQFVAALEAPRER